MASVEIFAVLIKGFILSSLLRSIAINTALMQMCTSTIDEVGVVFTSIH